MWQAVVPHMSSYPASQSETQWSGTEASFDIIVLKIDSGCFIYLFSKRNFIKALKIRAVHKKLCNDGKNLQTVNLIFHIHLRSFWKIV